MRSGPQRRAVDRAADLEPAPQAPGRRAGSRLDRPAGRWALAGLVGLILFAPLVILWEDLRSLSLFGDDFAYLAGSRDWGITWRHLLTPHNTHVVPVFRLGTFGLVALAGPLENLPMAFAAASYLGLMAAMLAVGALVAAEARGTAPALASMAVLGLSTVTHPSVTWYSAGQALWAGTAAVVTILLALAWSRKGGAWRLGLVALGALAAPATWTGGLVAGPAAVAYLWARDRRRVWGPAVVLTAATIGFGVLLFVLSRRELSEPKIIWERHPELWPRPIQAALHVAQAIVEALVLGNLGLDAATTPGQAVALLLALAACWAWSRRGRGPLVPLEAAGATLVLGSFLLVYVFRGNLPYSSLRGLGWYHAIGEVGAVLFAAGWWSALHPAGPGRLTLGQALAVLGLVLWLIPVHAPRSERMLIAGAPPLTPKEARLLPIPELQRLRARYFRQELRDRQVRTFARLDRLGRLARREGISPEQLRGLFGPVFVPGIPENQRGHDAFDLLAPLPPGARLAADPGRHRAKFADLIRPEDVPRPFWIDPSEPWPPKPDR